MKINVGGGDRVVRLLVGAALVLLGVFDVISGVAAIVGYIVAAVALITGTVRFCPLWAVCKINTVKKTAEKAA
jgi:hypothetical protein